jgi:hypothetical protein
MIIQVIDSGALGDSIRFGIFVVYQFHPGT